MNRCVNIAVTAIAVTAIITAIAVTAIAVTAIAVTACNTVIIRPRSGRNRNGCHATVTVTAVAPLAFHRLPVLTSTW